MHLKISDEKYFPSFCYFAIFTVTPAGSNPQFNICCFVDHSVFPMIKDDKKKEGEKKEKLPLEICVSENV